jgi:acetate kinase
VFTGGIGENSAEIRARVCRQAAWLGIELDGQANRAGGPQISHPESATAVLALRTDEEYVIANHTRRLLRAADDETFEPV